MFFLKWSHLKADNRKIKEYLNIGQAIHPLQIRSGFFISPDDYANRQSPLPKIITPENSIIDLFAKRYTSVCNDVTNFYRIVGGFDRLDYKKFKTGAKLAYFFAAVYYVASQKIPVAKINQLYQGNMQQDIEKKLARLLAGFVEMAAIQKQKITIFSLFSFAVNILIQAKISLPDDFETLTAFVSSSSYWPYGMLLGQLFEQQVQEIFEGLETKNETYLTKLISANLGSAGILIPIDEDEEFKKFASKKASGIKVPDYIFITNSAIHPIDLKVNLEFAKPEQIDAANLAVLFNKCYEKISAIFDGFSINGVTYAVKEAA